MPLLTVVLSIPRKVNSSVLPSYTFNQHPAVSFAVTILKLSQLIKRCFGNMLPFVIFSVQHECIPQAILGMDILCQAKSGMGKTAVFVLATLQQIEPVDGQVSWSSFACLSC